MYLTKRSRVAKRLEAGKDYIRNVVKAEIEDSGCMFSIVISCLGTHMHRRSIILVAQPETMIVILE